MLFFLKIVNSIPMPMGIIIPIKLALNEIKTSANINPKGESRFLCRRLIAKRKIEKIISSLYKVPAYIDTWKMNGISKIIIKLLSLNVLKKYMHADKSSTILAKRKILLLSRLRLGTYESITGQRKLKDDPKEITHFSKKDRSFSFIWLADIKYASSSPCSRLTE